MRRVAIVAAAVALTVGCADQTATPGPTTSTTAAVRPQRPVPIPDPQVDPIDMACALVYEFRSDGATASDFRWAWSVASVERGWSDATFEAMTFRLMADLSAGCPDLAAWIRRA